MRTDHHPYYGRVVRAGGYIALQYWMFYPFNDWRSRIYGVNDHEADWELLVIVVAVVAGFVVSVIAWGWRFAVTGTFWTLAAILLFANVQELGRD